MYILICFQTISAKYLLFLLNPNPFFQNVIHSSKYYWLNYPFTKKKPSSKYWSVFPKFDPFSRKLFVLLYILIHFKKMLSILPKWDPFFQKVILSSKYYFFSQNVDNSPKYRSVLQVTDLFFWIRGLLSHVSNMSFQFNSKIQTTISMLLSRAVFLCFHGQIFFKCGVHTKKLHITKVKQFF